MPALRSIRWPIRDALLALAAIASLHVVANSGALAERLELARFPWSDRLFYGAAVVAFLALGTLAFRLLGRIVSAGRRIRRDTSPGALVLGARGTVMAEFALVLPLMLLVACMIIQLALIVNASLVVRYAAFAAARSAIVNFEYKYLALPPFQEVFDQNARKDPELAAELVLAALSPARAHSGVPAASRMESVLTARGGAWPGRGYARRHGYASLTSGSGEATTMLTPSNGPGNYFASLSPLLPRLEHVIPPVLLDNPGPPRLPAPNANLLIPTSITITAGPVSFPVPIPAVIRNPLVNAANGAIGVLAQGSAAAYDVFAESPLNIDPISPKRVEVTIEYYFVMSVPGMSLIGVTDPAPWDSNVRVLKISHTVELQSTGTRQSSPLALIPVYDSTPLFW